MAATRTASRPPAPPESAYSHFYLIPGKCPVGFHGGPPPEGATWVCRVGDQQWTAVKAVAPSADRPAKAAASRSMFDPREEAA